MSEINYHGGGPADNFTATNESQRLFARDTNRKWLYIRNISSAGGSAGVIITLRFGTGVTAQSLKGVILLPWEIYECNTADNTQEEVHCITNGADGDLSYHVGH